MVGKKKKIKKKIRKWVVVIVEVKITMAIEGKEKRKTAAPVTPILRA